MFHPPRLFVRSTLPPLPLSSSHDFLRVDSTSLVLVVVSLSNVTSSISEERKHRAREIESFLTNREIIRAFEFFPPFLPFLSLSLSLCRCLNLPAQSADSRCRWTHRAVSFHQVLFLNFNGGNERTARTKSNLSSGRGCPPILLRSCYRRKITINSRVLFRLTSHAVPFDRVPRVNYSQRRFQTESAREITRSQ